MTALSLVTVCEQADLGRALVLAASFRAHHPEGQVLVVLADATEVRAPPEQWLDLITGPELAGDAYGPLAAVLAPGALARALVPTALRHRPGPALALAPDAEVLAPLAPPGSSLAVVASGDPTAGVCDDGALFADGAEEQLAALEQLVRDQGPDRLLEQALARFDDVELVREPGWAVAPWNAEARGAHAKGDALAVADGSPVAWVRRPADSALAPLPGQAAYEATVAAAELPEHVQFAFVLADGTPLDARLRRLFATGWRDGELDQAPFTPEGTRAFAAYLEAPAEDPLAGGTSRYLFDVWRSRPDLQATYPDLREATDRRGFLGWTAAHGIAELAVPGWLLPSGDIPEPPTEELTPPVGANVAGYFQSELGVGEAARRVVSALDAAHVPLLPVQTATVPPARRGHAYGVAASAGPFDFNLVCVNADGLPAFAQEVGQRFFARRHTIGSWWWELPTLPERYHGAFDHLDEVWVGSQYVYDAISPVAPIPVVKLPVAITRPVVTPRTRAELGLPEGFLVLFAFDYNSVLERKNPIGLIEAFTRAFPAGSGASLVIKATNGKLHPRDRQRLALAAQPHPDVHLLERHLPAEERDALIAACDLYASLHRSEGFGLTLAEAMALERPVLATGWSGNLEFMHAATTTLVDYELVPVGEGNAPYDAEQRWAEPDLDDAAAAMRAVREDPEGAAERARRAAERLLVDHAPRVVGEAMRARLQALAPRVADRFAAEPERGLTDRADIALDAAAERATRSAEDYPGDSRDPARRAVRRALIKAAAPVAANQRDADGALLEALRTVAEGLEERIDAESAQYADLTAATLAGQRRHAELLAQAEQRTRALDDELTQSRARIEALEARLAPVGSGVLERLQRAELAEPWTEGEPFGLIDHPQLGRVCGFRAGDAAPQATSYRSFEDVFRGSRERVRGLVERYAPLLADHAPVLDVGAGRGELLELLRDHDIEARGVDADRGMVDGAEEQGLDVTLADGIEHLEALEADSLGAVTAMHVIEHLPHAVLERFLRAARLALREGGLLVCETINPHAAFALKTFWVDPTHQHPLFPETMLVLARAAGFDAAYFTHIRGTGDVEIDRPDQDSYTLVATA